MLRTGASSGIGEAVARRFAVGGYRVVALARRKERLEQLARELSSLTEIEIVVADVTHKDAPERAVSAAMQRFGRLDCLVTVQARASGLRWATRTTRRSTTSSTPASKHRFGSLVQRSL